MNTRDNEPVFGDRYRLIWKSNRPDAIAQVRNFSTDEMSCRRLDVYLNPDFAAQRSMRFLCLISSDKELFIEVSPDFMALPPDMRLAGIWHEMGHIHHEHYLKDLEAHPEDDYNTIRHLAAKKGGVHHFELEADAFAVRQIGPEAVLKFLQFLLVTRPRGEKGSKNEAGRHELHLRIRAILNRQDEQIAPCKQPNPEAPFQWYFAYGSNMLKEQMEKRTGPIIESWPALLKHHELAFNKAGKDGTGKANIVRERGSLVFGVAYKCDRRALEQLDHYEGVSGGHYKRRFANITFITGEERRAVTYIAVPDKEDDGLMPSRAYLETIITGAREHRLPDDYIEQVSQKGTGYL